MIEEALTTKLSRERLEAIKKFLLEMRTDFSIGSEHLLAPITSATKDVKTATERAIWEEKDPTKQPRKETPLIDVFEKIAAETRTTR